MFNIYILTHYLHLEFVQTDFNMKNVYKETLVFKNANKKYQGNSNVKKKYMALKWEMG